MFKDHVAPAMAGLFVIGLKSRQPAGFFLLGKLFA